MSKYAQSPRPVDPEPVEVTLVPTEAVPIPPGSVAPPGPVKAVVRCSNWPITEERRRVFLEELAKTGMFNHSARTASPHLTGGTRPFQAGARTFRDLMVKDPQFASEVEEAKAAASGVVGREVVRRAVEGYFEDHYEDAGDKMALVKRIRKTDNRLLMALAKAFLPDLFGDQPQKHQHQHAAVLVSATLDDLSKLSRESREEVRRILAREATHDGGEDQAAGDASVS